MKKHILLLVIITWVISNCAHGQDTSYHSIQEVLNHHLAQLKANSGRYDHIFIQTKLDENISLPPKVWRADAPKY